jgi:hypothetical protein
MIGCGLGRMRLGPFLEYEEAFPFLGGRFHDNAHDRGDLFPIVRIIENGLVGSADRMKTVA